MPRSRRAAWQLPAGVTRGLWDYVSTDHIADEYDAYFAGNKLFDIDADVIGRHFRLNQGRPTWIADLGCGTGRALLPLVRQGFHGLAIDLSHRMLEIVGEKAAAENLPIACVQANLVELDGIADHAVDYAVSLFSTLGMIRGAANRLKSLREARRILRPGGIFVLHVHNARYNLRDPGGVRRYFFDRIRRLVDAEHEPGDRFCAYRDIPNMYLHAFTYRELRRLLRDAGFTLLETTPLDMRRNRLLPHPWLLGSFRATGWMIVASASFTDTPSRP